MTGKSSCQAGTIAFIYAKMNSTKFMISVHNNVLFAQPLNKSSQTNKATVVTSIHQDVPISGKPMIKLVYLAFISAQRTVKYSMWLLYNVKVADLLNMNSTTKYKILVITFRLPVPMPTIPLTELVSLVSISVHRPMISSM